MTTRPRTRQGNKAGRSAVSEDRSAALTGEFGMKILREKFPDIADEILIRLGVYSRGPRKGLQKGYVHWRKVTEGGWNYRLGFVEFPGSSQWRVLDGPDANYSVNISAAILQERVTAEEAKRAAEWEALPEWRRLVSRALKLRKRAHEEYAAFQRLGYPASEDFRTDMSRARQRLREARVLREGLLK